MMRRAILLLLLAAASVSAQTPGSCEPGVAQGDLDVGGSEVFARVFNRGNLFFGNSTTAGDGYLVPRETGISPVFDSVFWMGGKVDGQLRVAGARYTRFEFWPGPLEPGAVLPNPADCRAYDRIFVVSKADVADYLRTGNATNDLQDWPMAWGAPVLDGDGIEGNYNLAGGDEPAISGDQMAWWVMNDVGNLHAETGSNPLGIEVQASAIAVGSGILALKQATFYRYRILNRSANVIDDAYVSLFMDSDLGDAADDWVGSDTTLSMVYVYNGSDRDAVYGTPPAQGYQVVQGAIGLPNGRDDDEDGEVDEPDERLGMTAATYFCGGCPNQATTDMRTKEEYYSHMQGFWKDGTPFTEAGFGYMTDGPPTVFVFAGDPVTDQCWSMANNCEGGSVQPNDQRLIVHSGPFQLQPGEETEVVFALPFGQGTSNLDSVTKLREAAFITRAAWQSGLLLPSRVGAEPPPPDAFDLQVSPPFPNPFNDQTTIRYEISDPIVARISVFDVLGREVVVLVNGEQPAGSYEVEFSGAGLAPGVYVVRFEVAGEERTFSVVKLRP